MVMVKCFLCYSYTSNIEDDEIITGEGVDEDNEIDTQGAFSGSPSVEPVQTNHISEGMTQNLTFCNLLFSVIYCFL